MVRAKQVDDENSSPSASLKSESKVGSRRSAPVFSSSSSSIASDASTKKGGKNGKAHNNENADESSTSDDESGEQLELYYSKLQSSLSLSVPPSAGLLCDECGFSHGVLLECQGPCQRVIHQECLGLLENSFEKSNGNKREAACFKCDECRTGQHVCFVCKLGYDVEPSQPATRKCAVASCGKFYHDKCVESSELFRKDASWTTNKPAYICPQHACNTCWVDYKMNKRQTTDMNACTRGRFTKCVACPTAYHQSEYCIGAGSKLYNTTQLLCPLHFKPSKSSSQHNRISVTWCFVCCQTGELIGCSRCPAAYHSDCLAANDARYVIDEDDEDETNTNTNGNGNNKSVKKKTTTTTTPVKPPKESVSNIDKNNWLCEDCLVNKRPLYGEIVWAKVGQYRWWPAQICLPRSLGNALVQCQVGEFTVKFYGTFDYHALNLGRCFTFAEGDEGGTSRNSSGGSSAASSLSSLPSSGGNTLERAFARACRQAKHAHKEVERLRAARAPKTPLNKYNFQMIKTNRPYGNVQISKVQLQDVPKCDCSPNEVAPCGSDSTCMNRMLKYECHPLVCPAGARCLNQRFMKREYPKQEPINAGDRGWGLRTLVDIKKGDFVNEYVGEIIDDEECKRRMDLAHANNITNFYFLTIDQGRVIDAGPKGNLARFANHSCDPNMETQKWVVNGDIRVGLFACKDIPAGTELTFNYQLDCLSNNKAVCKCGTKVCAGFIGDRPKQLPTSSSQQQLQNGSGSGSKSATNNGNNNKKRKISDAVELLSTSAASNEAKKSKSELSRIRSQSTIVSNLK